MARVAWRGNLAIEAARENPGNDNKFLHFSIHVPTSQSTLIDSYIVESLFFFNLNHERSFLGYLAHKQAVKNYFSKNHWLTLRIGKILFGDYVLYATSYKRYSNPTMADQSRLFTNLEKHDIYGKDY